MCFISKLDGQSLIHVYRVSFSLCVKRYFAQNLNISNPIFENLPLVKTELYSCDQIVLMLETGLPKSYLQRSAVYEPNDTQ